MPKVMKILTIEDPKEEKILREISKEVTPEQLKSSEFRDFLHDLLHTAKNSNDQVGFNAGGIAAIQVGRPLRVFYTLNYDTDEFELFINPKVDVVKPSQIVAKEGCLSIPNREGNVARFEKVRVTYLDLDGNIQKKNYTGWNARGIQHETDHLNGVLYIDKLVD